MWFPLWISLSSSNNSHRPYCVGFYLWLSLNNFMDCLRFEPLRYFHWFILSIALYFSCRYPKQLQGLLWIFNHQVFLSIHPEDVHGFPWWVFLANTKDSHKLLPHSYFPQFDLKILLDFPQGCPQPNPRIILDFNPCGISTHWSLADTLGQPTGLLQPTKILSPLDFLFSTGQWIHIFINICVWLNWCTNM